MRRLARSVIVTDPKTKETSFLRAGAEVTEAVAKTITNPAVLEPADGAEETDPLADRREPVAGGEYQGKTFAELLDLADERGLEVDEETATTESLVDALTEPPAPPASDPADQAAADKAEAERLAKVLEGKVDAVNEHITAHPEDGPALLALEAQAEKPRTGITEGPHATPPAQQ